MDEDPHKFKETELDKEIAKLLKDDEFQSTDDSSTHAPSAEVEKKDEVDEFGLKVNKDKTEFMNEDMVEDVDLG